MFQCVTVLYLYFQRVHSLMICRRIGVLVLNVMPGLRWGIVQNTQQYFIGFSQKCEFIIVIKNRRSSIWTVITYTQSLRHFLMKVGLLIRLRMFCKYDRKHPYLC